MNSKLIKQFPDYTYPPERQINMAHFITASFEKATLPELIKIFFSKFNKLKVPYALGGALATNFYSKKPRNTQDIDVYILPNDKNKVLKGIKQLFPNAKITPIHSDFQYIIELPEFPNLEIDILIPYGDPYESAIELAKGVIINGVKVKVPPIELVILMLALSDLQKHKMDLENLFLSGSVDINKLKMYIDYLGDPEVKQVLQPYLKKQQQARKRMISLLSVTNKSLKRNLKC